MSNRFFLQGLELDEFMEEYYGEGEDFESATETSEVDDRTEVHDGLSDKKRLDPTNGGDVWRSTEKSTKAKKGIDRNSFETVKYYGKFFTKLSDVVPQSVCLIVPKSHFLEGTNRLRGQTLEDHINSLKKFKLEGVRPSHQPKLSNLEVFRDEFSVRNTFTGFVIEQGKRTFVATAGHGIYNKITQKAEPEKYVFIFNYGRALEIKPDTIVDPRKIKVENMFVAEGEDTSKKKPTHRVKYSKKGDDFALISIKPHKLNTDADALKKLKKFEIKIPGTVPRGIPRKRLYSFGYPWGLSLKAELSGRLLSKSYKRELKVLLDAYAGDSGAPVMSADHKLAGMVLRGEDDFLIAYDDTDDRVIKSASYGRVGRKRVHTCQRADVMIDELGKLKKDL